MVVRLRRGPADRGPGRHARIGSMLRSVPFLSALGVRAGELRDRPPLAGQRAECDGYRDSLFSAQGNNPPSSPENGWRAPSARAAVAVGNEFPVLSRPNREAVHGDELAPDCPHRHLVGWFGDRAVRTAAGSEDPAGFRGLWRSGLGRSAPGDSLLLRLVSRNRAPVSTREGRRFRSPASARRDSSG